MKINEQNGLVTDVDGTIYNATANQMRAKGYNVIVVDLINPAHSNKFNPLKGIQLNDDRIDELLETIFSKVKTEGDNAVFLESGKSLTKFMINELIYKGKMNNTVPTFNALFSELIGLTNVGLIEKL